MDSSSSLCRILNLYEIEQNNLKIVGTNSPVHKASNITVLEWTAKSPDMSIAEDVWKLLSYAIYDGPPYQNKAFLLEKIHDVINDINQSKRHLIKNVYKGMISRLCKVLLCQGGLFNK